MYNKIRISGNIVVKSGLHIGGSSQFSAIGAVDSPVIRDTFTNYPIIPGSSLKGKMRTLLAKYYSENNSLKMPNDDPQQILELFGGSKKRNDLNNEIVRGRLQFVDSQLINMDELKEHMLDSAVEVKFENTIDRLTAEANPRQIERVIRESKFRFEIMYDAWFSEDEYKREDIQEIIRRDFVLLGTGMYLLQLDYLGGNGSRGYGKILFEKESIDVESLLGSSQIEGQADNMYKRNQLNSAELTEILKNKIEM